MCRCPSSGGACRSTDRPRRPRRTRRPRNRLGAKTLRRHAGEASPRTDRAAAAQLPSWRAMASLMTRRSNSATRSRNDAAGSDAARRGDSRSAGRSASRAGVRSRCVRAMVTVSCDSGLPEVVAAARSAARAMRFSNSRTFPGHSLSVSLAFAMASRRTLATPIRRAEVSAKCDASNGMSSRRSRSAGTRRGNTARR